MKLTRTLGPAVTAAAVAALIGAAGATVGTGLVVSAHCLPSKTVVHPGVGSGTPLVLPSDDQDTATA